MTVVRLPPHLLTDLLSVHWSYHSLPNHLPIYPHINSFIQPMPHPFGFQKLHSFNAVQMLVGTSSVKVFLSAFFLLWITPSLLWGVKAHTASKTSHRTSHRVTIFNMSIFYFLLKLSSMHSLCPTIGHRADRLRDSWWISPEHGHSRLCQWLSCFGCCAAMWSGSILELKNALSKCTIAGYTPPLLGQTSASGGFLCAIAELSFLWNLRIAQTLFPSDPVEQWLTNSCGVRCPFSEDCEKRSKQQGKRRKGEDAQKARYHSETSGLSSHIISRFCMSQTWARQTSAMAKVWIKKSGRKCRTLH